MASIYRTYLDNIKASLKRFTTTNIIAMKFKLMSLLCELNTVTMLFAKVEKQYSEAPAMLFDSDVDYAYWKDPKNWEILCGTEGFCKLIRYDGKMDDTDEAKRIIDYLYPDEKLDHNQDGVNKVKLLVDTIYSDTSFSDRTLYDAIKISLSELIKKLNTIDNLRHKGWNNADYLNLYNNLEKEYSCQIPALHPAYKDFCEWKAKLYFDYVDVDEYNGKLSSELEKFINTKFIYSDDEHTSRKYNDVVTKLGSLIEFAKLDEKSCKQYYTLIKILGFKNGRFLFDNKTAIAKYIFIHSNIIGEEDVKAFFYFKRMYELLYKDLDNTTSPTEDIKYKYIINKDRKKEVFDFLLSEFQNKKGKDLALYAECAVDAQLISDMDIGTLKNYYKTGGSSTAFNNYFKKDRFTADEKNGITAHLKEILQDK